MKNSSPSTEKEVLLQAVAQAKSRHNELLHDHNITTHFIPTLHTEIRKIEEAAASSSFQAMHAKITKNPLSPN